MDLNGLREISLSLPGATEDVKWGKDLCFSVGGKMFCVTGFEPDCGVSLKVGDDEFDELCETDGTGPAPYVGRYKWIAVRSFDRFTDDEWRYRVRRSYELIAAKLPAKLRPRG
jgi:predicted DNA-binding protein (MmcQ/YjbR family)